MKRILSRLILAASLVCAAAVPAFAQRRFDGYTIFVPTTVPRTPDEGAVYQNQTDHVFYIYNGSTWIAVGTVNPRWSSVGSGDDPSYFAAGGNIPADATAGTYPVPIYGLNLFDKRTVASVAVRQSASINFLAVQPVVAGANWQRAQYNVVDVGSGDSTGGRYVASQNEVYHWDNHAAASAYGSRNEVFNGIYGCISGGQHCGGGAITNAYGSYNYIHQMTNNASNAITNAFGSVSIVDSNSNMSPVTNAYGVSGWVFGDAADNGGVKNISVAQGGDFEVVPAGAGSTITTAYGVYQTIGPAGAGTVTTGYGNYVDVVVATTKWGYYNNDATAPSYSKSNWRAPFIASDASSVLSVASNTVAPTNMVHHVGAGLIKTITVPTMCSPTCTVWFVPDAAFTYDATGNIVVPAGAGTATTSRAMSFTWDGTKWYPSY